MPIKDTEKLPKKSDKTEYSGHDYFDDLDKKVHFWRSIQKAGASLPKQGTINNFPIPVLHKVREEVLDYLKEFYQKNGHFLTDNVQIQAIYDSLQGLLTEANEFQKESVPKFINTSFLLAKFDYYMACVSLLEKERKIQQQRIKDIQAFITHTQKQLDLEKKRLESSSDDKKTTASALEQSFDSTRSIIYKFSTPRYHFLEEVVKREKKEIKDIESDLQNKANEILQETDKEFGSNNQEQIIKSLRETKKALKAGNDKAVSLKLKLDGFKKVVSSVEQKAQEPGSGKSNPKKNEKLPEEKITDAFNSALTENKNLVLTGKYRSLGLTNSVIKEIMEDEEFGQDIIEHVSGLLNTPQGQDFGWSGNSRWKPFQGSKGTLYELSVNPQKGHSQSMPRLYAKKELFTQQGNLTNKKDKGPTENIWVLVKKGSKRTQDNDKNTAGKVHFKNDGDQHTKMLNINDLEWMKINLCPDSKIPVVAFSLNQGRV